MSAPSRGPAIPSWQLPPSLLMGQQSLEGGRLGNRAIKYVGQVQGKSRYKVPYKALDEPRHSASDEPRSTDSALAWFEISSPFRSCMNRTRVRSLTVRLSKVLYLCYYIALNACRTFHTRHRFILSQYLNRHTQLRGASYVHCHRKKAYHMRCQDLCQST